MKENDETKRAANVKVADRKQAEEKAARKRLEEMNLLEDFLFGAMVTYPGIGEQFVRMLLKIIFGREFKHLSVTAQKVFYGADTNLHGARLDVYLEPEIEDNSEGRATVYDMEPDRKDSAEDKRVLPRRMRFYHAKITARSLNAGADYGELKNVIIIMIMPYDPFGLKRMIYTVKNRCVEVPDMEYEDGAETVFLYTGGTQGVPNEGLEQLLHYLENTTYENAANTDLHEIHRMVETVKNDPEVIARHMIGYLKRQEEVNRVRREFDRIREELDEANEELNRTNEELNRTNEELNRTNEELNRTNEELGRTNEELDRTNEELDRTNEELDQVRKELDRTGERCREEGQAAGDIYRLTVQICKKMKMGQPLEKIAEDLMEETAVIEPIYNTAEKFAPEYNPDQIFEQVNVVIKNSCSV